MGASWLTQVVYFYEVKHIHYPDTNVYMIWSKICLHFVSAHIVLHVFQYYPYLEVEVWPHVVKFIFNIWNSHVYCLTLLARALILLTGALDDLNKAISLSRGTGSAACQAYTQRGLIYKLEGTCLILIIPLQTKFGRNIGFTLSVCLSV